MRVNWNHIKLVLLLFVTVFLYAFASHRNSERMVPEVRVQFEDESTPFVTRAAVNKLLIQNKEAATKTTKEKLALKEMETRVNSHPIIKRAQVYVGMDGVLGVDVEQRVPIARLNGQESFYIDEDGKRMPLSNNFSARVPLVEGVGDVDVDDVYELIKFINEDSFLEKHIVGLKKQLDGDYVLMPRTLNYKLILGKVEKLPLKFNNYKAFYKKAENDKTLKDYRLITLKYDNQVVCTKR